MTDIGAPNWNEDDNSNTAAAPEGAPEGMAPSGVNNVLRAHQGALKRWYNKNQPKVTGGSSTAYTVSYGVTPTALYDGDTHLICFNTASGAGATLDVNAQGAKPIHYYSFGAWRVVPANLWGADTVFWVSYNLAAGAYRILGFPDRTGELVPFAGSTAPAGSLLCQGQVISRTAYAGLFAALSTTYGAGDGSTTFKLPDLRDRVPGGAGSTWALGAAVGSATHTLTISEMPIHLHVLGSSVTVAAGGSYTVPAIGPPGYSSANEGGGAAHNNVQPTLALNYLIRL